ncbi:hypothetical protein F511_17829 [Dorcoceras hygrometricum]|uniref:Uncharacterized protein n=1 Tax=Dorcoceras hygrometricum TaxID=472368 RepID=A0A2Z7ABA7_9LAMI|nr:hypothetical protein F511_17829 [Dorcoceras hygrometricum]
MELKKMYQKNGQVKEFVTEKVRGGYSVDIAGHFAFLPIRPHSFSHNSSDRFYIESINPDNIVVVMAS